ncbi:MULTISPECIES: FecR family protein [unclassified Sphingomonas]|jgi:transmembrane sensor|uniref:FecR family protein n=1 Tax=unclassified Sphingomonas TaxID=196159 RepID=UPI00083793E7|nr:MULTISPECIES: FecR domain-containing protein [unclassified Sphingomonas]
MDHRGDGSRAPDLVREQAIAWLARLRSGPTDDERGEFLDWYSADARHANTYDALLDSWDDTGLAAQTPIGERSRAATRQRRTRVVAAAAAAVLVLLVAGTLAMNGFVHRDTTTRAMLASRVGEIRTITLEDGSRVTLDTDSVVRVRYDGDQRRLELQQGRARFAVAHDAERPFIVAAGPSEVVAHGTVFDVDRRPDRIVVALLEGSVEVRRNAPTAGSEPTRLAPGQQLAIGGSAAPARPTMIRPPEARWPSGMLSFEDAPLAEVVASANRYSSTQIIIADPAAGQHRFTGTFKPGEPSRLAETIGSMFRLRVDRDRPGTLVLASDE